MICKAAKTNFKKKCRKTIDNQAKTKKMKKVLDGAIHLCYTILAFGRRRSFFYAQKTESLLIYYDGGGDCASKDHIGMYGLQAA